MESNFDRALSTAFIAKLAVEAHRDGWWVDVLADPKLIVALRGNYLNVYWRGQSLFRAESTSSGFNVTTHAKYLIDPKLASQVTLTDRDFDISSLAEKGFIRRYEGPATIEKMKAAAGLFSGLEKTGCHEIAVRNSGVIDCEIAFPGKISLDDGGEDRQAPRIDIAAIESYGDEARLVFWEAKHYSNGELRAEDGQAPVLRQVRIYTKYLSENREAIERSYTRVAENLLSISNMGWKHQLSPLIADVATGRRALTLGAEPAVGLVIFGFDSAQRDHAGWKAHRERLEREIIHVRAAGDAKNIRLST
jgi:hypothetical protein